jgi:predicted TIM-barrel enzyme
MSGASVARHLADVFTVPKPILGMLHLKGVDRADVVTRALREADILVANGIDGLVVEDYFGSVEDVAAVLERFAAVPPGVPYGVNVLDDGPASFALAARFGAAFVQMDSVAGHLGPDDDAAFAAELAGLRTTGGPLLLGGVRFKYQPVLSGNAVEVDLREAVRRCDAVVVTGPGTGMETSMEKVRAFRAVLGPGFPLVVGAGLTAENCGEALAVADAAIVGSSLKDTLAAHGDVAAARVVELMVAVRAVRREAASAPGPGPVRA